MHVENSLDLRERGLRSLRRVLRHERHVSSVDASINNLSSLGGVPRSLRALDVSVNPKLTSLQALAVCRNLRILLAEDCSITDAQVVAELPLLKRLSLANNSLLSTALPPLPETLQELDLSSNPLHMLPALSQCDQLRTLSLRDTVIASLHDASSCLPASLVEIDLSETKLASLSDLLALAHACPSLHSLQLHGTPLLQDTSFDVRPLVLRLLPHLKYLNGEKVPPRLWALGQALLRHGDSRLLLPPSSDNDDIELRQRMRLLRDYLRRRCSDTISSSIEELDTDHEVDTWNRRYARTPKPRRKRHLPLVQRRALTPRPQPSRLFGRHETSRISRRTHTLDLNEYSDYSFENEDESDDEEAHRQNLQPSKLSILSDGEGLATHPQRAPGKFHTPCQRQRERAQPSAGFGDNARQVEYTPICSPPHVRNAAVTVRRTSSAPGHPALTTLSPTGTTLLSSSPSHLQLRIEVLENQLVRLTRHLERVQQRLTALETGQHMQVHHSATHQTGAQHATDSQGDYPTYSSDERMLVNDPRRGLVPVPAPPSQADLRRRYRSLKNLVSPPPEEAHKFVMPTFPREEVLRHAAALRIQRAWRGTRTRLRLREHLMQSLAATIIQRFWRGYRQRKRFRRLLIAEQQRRIRELESALRHERHSRRRLQNDFVAFRDLQQRPTTTSPHRNSAPAVQQQKNPLLSTQISLLSHVGDQNLTPADSPHGVDATSVSDWACSTRASLDTPGDTVNTKAVSVSSSALCAQYNQESSEQEDVQEALASVSKLFVRILGACDLQVPPGAAGPASVVRAKVEFQGAEGATSDASESAVFPKWKDGDFTFEVDEEMLMADVRERVVNFFVEDAAQRLLGMCSLDITELPLTVAPRTQWLHLHLPGAHPHDDESDTERTVGELQVSVAWLRQLPQLLQHAPQRAVLRDLFQSSKPHSPLAGAPPESAASSLSSSASVSASINSSSGDRRHHSSRRRRRKGRSHGCLRLSKLLIDVVALSGFSDEHGATCTPSGTVVELCFHGSTVVTTAARPDGIINDKLSFDPAEEEEAAGDMKLHVRLVDLASRHVLGVTVIDVAQHCHDLRRYTRWFVLLDAVTGEESGLRLQMCLLWMRDLIIAVDTFERTWEVSNDADGQNADTTAAATDLS
ncbi:MAG: hypothetical protein MHM6MM_003493 [Cercozoa sp. M6MM]